MPSKVKMIGLVVLSLLVAGVIGISLAADPQPVPAGKKSWLDIFKKAPPVQTQIPKEKPIEHTVTITEKDVEANVLPVTFKHMKVGSKFILMFDLNKGYLVRVVGTHLSKNKHKGALSRDANVSVDIEVSDITTLGALPGSIKDDVAKGIKENGFYFVSENMIPDVKVPEPPLEDCKDGDTSGFSFEGGLTGCICNQALGLEPKESCAGKPNPCDYTCGCKAGKPVWDAIKGKCVATDPGGADPATPEEAKSIVPEPGCVVLTDKSTWGDKIEHTETSNTNVYKILKDTKLCKAVWFDRRLVLEANLDCNGSVFKGNSASPDMQTAAEEVQKCDGGKKCLKQAMKLYTGILDEFAGSIANCTVEGFYTGIYYDGSDSSIYNSTIKKNKVGIYSPYHHGGYIDRGGCVLKSVICDNKFFDIDEDLKSYQGVFTFYDEWWCDYEGYLSEIGATDTDKDAGNTCNSDKMVVGSKTCTELQNEYKEDGYDFKCCAKPCP